MHWLVTSVRTTSYCEFMLASTYHVILFECAYRSVRNHSRQQRMGHQRLIFRPVPVVVVMITEFVVVL